MKGDEEKIKKAAEFLVKKDMDAMLLTWPTTVYYMTGFPVNNLEFALYRPTVTVVSSEGDQSLIVAKIHAQKVEETTSVEDVKLYPDDEFYEGTWMNHVIDTLNQMKAKEVGIEKRYTPFSIAEIISKRRPQTKIKDCSDIIIKMRSIKSKDEVEAMREAVKITEELEQYAFDSINEGMTELEVCRAMIQWKLEHNVLNPLEVRGVTTGVRTGSVGVHASDKKIKRGDIINIDTGITIRGYWSDVTRNAVLGKPSEKLLEIFNMVYEANKAGREAVRPDVKASEVDAAARRIIEKAGYSKYFFWNTGHGLGLVMHERPVIAATDHTVLQPGMTFTIEPGAKIPNLLGVHIEDDIVVTEDGYESLSTMTRELIRL